MSSPWSSRADVLSVGDRSPSSQSGAGRVVSRGRGFLRCCLSRLDESASAGYQLPMRAKERKGIRYE